MFAPKVAKTPTKAANNPKSSLAPRQLTVARSRLGRDPAERILFLQRTIGNQATLRLLGHGAARGASGDFGKIPPSSPDRTSRGSSPQPGIIQRELVVGQSDDPLEHEADRVADQVMRTPVS